MQLVRTIAEVREAVRGARSKGRRIALVPTMGALHAGHLSLMNAARDSGAFVTVSIFVNPTQFGPNEDFSRYPRDEAGDLQRCREAAVDLVFAPDADEIYAGGAVTTVYVARVTETLCGPFRPGHFDGVATVVAKLFNIFSPDVAYFGQKDAQQLAVIRRMVLDLNFPIEVVGCPTVREPDGLALSSRNRYLTPDERRQALSVPRALAAAERLVVAGERRSEEVVSRMREILDSAGPVRIDYISVVDPVWLQPVAEIRGRVLVALAVHIGRTRLIDNVTLEAELAVDPGCRCG